MKRKKFIIFVIGILIIIGFLFSQKKTNPFDKIKSINGYPIYPNSRFSKLLSFTGEKQWLLTYLSDDKATKVIKFYEKKLNKKVEKTKYGKSLIIYQFPKEYTLIHKRKLLKEGVEIIPFGGFYRKVFKARTKIKIYLIPPPPKE